MEKNGKIFLISSILIAVILLGAITFVVPGITGPDNPPPQVIAGWYFPGKTIVLTDPGSKATGIGADHLVMSGQYDGTPTNLPTLSRFSHYENYTHETTGERYQITAWYCEDQKTCLKAESVLAAYLEGNGTLYVRDLDFNEQTENSEDIIKRKIPLLQFESTATSGYFLEIEKPLGSMKGDRIIQYYSTQRSSLGPSQELILKNMVVETFSGRMVPAFAALG